MRKTFFVMLMGVWILSFSIPVVAAQVTSSDTFKKCGAYSYNIKRVVDGFQIRVTDGARVRTMFYRDVISGNGVTGSESNVMSECEGSSLVFLDRTYGKYSQSYTVKFLDPTQDSLRINALDTVTSVNYGTVEMKSKNIAQIDAIMSKPQDKWEILKTELVQKQRIPAEKSDMLNDQSYYVFDGKGGITRKMSKSLWNTTLAEGVVVCDNGIAYILYAKQFADIFDASSTRPAVQYVIERSGDGNRKLIPIPFVDGSWGSYGWNDLSVGFGACIGENASVFVNERVSIVSGKTIFVDHKNPTTSLAPSYFGNSYYSVENIWRYPDGSIKGDATIKTLNPDGTVTEKKPVFFQDLRKFSVGTSMQFRKDPRDESKIVVRIAQPRDNYDEPQVVKYYLESSGIYSEVSRVESEWKWPNYADDYMTPLYVSAEKNMLVVKSFFLKKPMLLHVLPTENFTLLWQRIGPLELDGTRKVWYAFKINGKTQTWLATVR
ncbi:hypothetical protein KKF59_01015 [Patescibacteria group bacterium]|nr:hypothetical protein [Patescibacteria group bacterium]MBU1034450.1 hypothetical protein [Patescibacteria group bacterium]MBU1630012.1 hypothetical protein [Patescibacteria group bacterium]MBU1907695.1 hypothetical protein [Patescibacteria group bacterium]